jgi:hypothetical protein
MVVLPTDLFAGGPRMDPGSDLPGAFGCWVDGFDDGVNHSFNDDRNKECQDIDDQYNRGFSAGSRCVDGKVDGHIESDCTDAERSNDD